VSVPYQRLLRVHPRYRWWRPFVALALLLGFWLVTQILISVIAIVIVIASGGAGGAESFLTELQKDPLSSAHPASLAITLVSLVVLLPAIMVSVRLARLGPIGQLSSVRFRIRWGWMARCLLPLFVLLLLMVGIQGFAPGGMFVIGAHGITASPSIGHPTVSTVTMWIGIAMSIVLVPFQAAAEEFIFRGFVMQAVGSWIRWRWPVVPVLVSTFFFAIAHVPNGYNAWAIVDVGSFGCIAALLVWRTGGLEAGILAHALNNTVIFVLQAPGWSKLDTSGGNENWTGPAVTILTLGIYALLVELLAKRVGLDRTRPGREVPRFSGEAPAWAGSDTAGWTGAPALVGEASGVLHSAMLDDDAVGGRP
jgi:membrane protease YdiL (CAAX protease family)